MDAKQIYSKVQEHYTSAAKSASSGYGQTVLEAFGYTEDELAKIPQEANLGLSCGNPLALAELRDGETVINLGSGAGFDIFLAANKVGANGKAIGVDMNKKMLEKANQNKDKANADNVLFIDSAITKIALPDETADCIISNCVVNLVPEQKKQLAFNEMFRLLRPGGRVSMSDILIKNSLPAEFRKSMALYVGCIAGASQIKDYENYLRKAGFSDILIVNKKHDLNVCTDTNQNGTKSLCCGSETDKSCCRKSASCCNNDEAATSEDLEASGSKFKDVNFNEWAGSFQIYAVKT